LKKLILKILRKLLRNKIIIKHRNKNKENIQIKIKDKVKIREIKKYRKGEENRIIIKKEIAIIMEDNNQDNK
jgi:hypothetical protein